MNLPIIGITTDYDGEKQFIRPGYAQMVDTAGGIPFLLPQQITLIPQYVKHCSGFIFTGGDDPIMEHWNIPTHAKATKVQPERQQFELALLDELASNPDKPVLGICLGMQFMALNAGGSMDQHLPDTNPQAASIHWGKKLHSIEGELCNGEVLSHHRQIITDAGKLTVCATSEDGIIEAVQDKDRAFYKGVQWHPEKTDDENTGIAIFDMFLNSCRIDQINLTTAHQ